MLLGGIIPRKFCSVKKGIYAANFGGGQVIITNGSICGFRMAEA